MGNKKKRNKKMPLTQYEHVLDRKWTPVQLLGKSRIEWMKNIPSHLVDSVYASGSCTSTMNYTGDYPLPSGDIIGGMDVYRTAKDDPVELNKDWYAVIVDKENDNMLLVCGPIKDDEHWIDEIPERLKGATIYDVPPK